MAPHDGRLFAKFDINTPDHPKIALLSDGAFRAWFDMVCYARKHRLDGRLAKRLAVATWGDENLRELCTNDDENPSLILADDHYLIHDFADWQPTNATIAARQEQAKAAGQLGGLAKGKRNAKQPAKQTAKRTASKTLSENVADTDTEKGTPYGVPSVSPYPLKNGALPHRHRDAFEAEADAETIDARTAERQARLDAIDACTLCDEDGYRPNFTVCDHTDRSITAAKGAKAVRQTMGWKT